MAVESPTHFHATLLATDRNRSRWVYLIEPVTPEDNAPWAVVAIPASQKEALKRGMSDWTVNGSGTRLPLRDYGTIILEGYGKLPDDIEGKVHTAMGGSLPPPFAESRYL